MSAPNRALALAQAIGADIKDATIDSIALARIEHDARLAVRTLNKSIVARLNDVNLFTESWGSTGAWAGSGTVASNRMYSSAGLTRAAPATTRWVARATLHATGTSGKFAYFGVGASSNPNDLVGIGQGSGAAAAATLRGSNISASALVIPRTLPNLLSGDYLVTVARDETYISLTIQAVAGGQNVWGARVPVSALPGGVANTIFMSANDTAAGGLNWGPMMIYSELAVPPQDTGTISGYALWGTNKPLAFYTADAITGFGRIISIPGHIDSTKPAPIMMYLHQAASGTAVTPWSDSRMANVTAAMEGAGYIIVASDNGPGITAGGTQDKYGNQAGLDDYVSLIDWTRKHFVTGSLVLLGPSMGSFFAENLLMQKNLGGIAAVATISGGTNLIVMEQDPAYQAAIRTAYGALDTPSFVTAAKPFDPISKPGWKFRGVPHRFYVGSTDVTAPPAVQNTPFVTKIAPYSLEESVVSLAVGHLDPSLYQGTDVLAFFQKYVQNNDYDVFVDSLMYDQIYQLQNDLALVNEDVQTREPADSSLVRANLTGIELMVDYTGDFSDLEPYQIAVADLDDLSTHSAHQFVAPPNWYVFPDVRSSGGAVQTVGRCNFYPVMLKSGTYDGFAISRSTASAGGANVVLLVGLYGITSDGFPDTAAGPLMSVSIPLNASSVGTANVATPIDVPEGQYFIGTVYTYTTVPTTAPQVSCNSAGGWPLPAVTWQSPGTYRGWYRAGPYTALPTADPSTSANIVVSTTGDIPIVGVRKVT